MSADTVATRTPTADVRADLRAAVRAAVPADPGACGAIRPVVSAQLAALCRCALVVGDRPLLDGLLSGLTASGRSRHAADGGPGPDAAASTAAVLEALSAGLAVLDGGRPGRRHGDLAAAVASVARPERFLHALPLLRLALGDAPGSALDSLPVPTVAAGDRALWRAARTVLAAGAAASGADVAAAVAERRALLVEHGPGALGDVDTATGWLLLLARVGPATRDAALCRAVADALAARVAEIAVLGSVLPVGPVGWFVADVLAALGRHEEALLANASAADVSRRIGSRPWQVRCRLQRLRLSAAQQQPVVPAPAAGRPAGPVTPAAATAPSPAAPSPAAPSPAAPTVPAPPQAADHRLTPRQRRILELAAAGLTNAQIARELYLSVATVERHCTMAYRTLGVRNRAQALGRLAGTATG